MTHADLSRFTVHGLRLFLLQTENVAPCLDVVVLARVVGAAHAVYDGVRNLVDGGHEHRFNGALLFGRERAEAVALPLKLFLRDAAQFFFERADRGADVEVTQRLLELHHLGLDNQLCALGLALALSDVGGDDGFEVVNVEDEEVLEFGDRGVYVSRHADVYEEGGRIAARLSRSLGHLRRDDVGLRARRADYDVGFGEMLFESGELNRLAAELNGKLLRGLVGSVGDEYARRARTREVLRSEFGHLARADQENGRAFQRAENLSPQLDCREADRDSRGSDAGLAADSLGDTQRLVNETVEDSARRACLDGDCVCVSNLTEHLRLADDERVERGGDAEDVSHGSLVGVRVELAVEEFYGDGARVAQETAQALGCLGPFRPRRRGQNLHAVARRDDP